jgi:hypothetical protein
MTPSDSKHIQGTPIQPMSARMSLRMTPPASLDKPGYLFYRDDSVERPSTTRFLNENTRIISENLRIISDNNPTSLGNVTSRRYITHHTPSNN